MTIYKIATDKSEYPHLYFSKTHFWFIERSGGDAEGIKGVVKCAHRHSVIYRDSWRPVMEMVLRCATSNGKLLRLAGVEIFEVENESA